MATPLEPVAHGPDPLRAIRWSHPRIAYPRVIELGLARISAALDAPGSVQWAALFGAAPVPGKERERRKRCDGAVNVATVLSTLIAAADLMRGLVATPAGEGWQRKTWSDVDVLGFGSPVPGRRSLRRTERAAAELEAQGFIRSSPWRVMTPAGIRGTPGLKFVTDKLWKILGLWSTVQTERRRRKQRSADEKKRALEASIGATIHRLDGRPGAAPAPPAAAPKPHATSPPAQAGPKPVSEVAAAALAKIKQQLGD